MSAGRRLYGGTMALNAAAGRQPHRYDWEERLRNACMALRVSVTGEANAVSLTDLFEDGGRPEEVDALLQAVEILALEQDVKATIRVLGGSFTVRFTRKPP